MTPDAVGQLKRPLRILVMQRGDVPTERWCADVLQSLARGANGVITMPVATDTCQAAVLQLESMRAVAQNSTTASSLSPEQDLHPLELGYWWVGAAQEVATQLANAEGPLPVVELLVLLDRGFGTWGWSDYQSLQAAFPLARLVTITGPWAAGGQRSSQQTEASFYLPYSSWEPQWSLFLQQRSANRPTIWDGPVVQSRTAQLAKGNQETAIIPRQLGLLASETSMSEALKESLQRIGHTVQSWKMDWPRTPECNWAPLLEKWSTQAARPIDLWLCDLNSPVPDPGQVLKMREALPGPCVILLGNAEILAAGSWQEIVQTPQTILLRRPFLMDELQSAIGNLSFQDR